ncbi:reverse transcriptase domain-containing protein [Tanacetum coccineum]
MELTRWFPMELIDLLDLFCSSFPLKINFYGLGTTLDIFQNIILIPYLGYGILSVSGYGVLSFYSTWSFVSVGWNRNVRMALGAKLKLGFIDGSCPKPGAEDANLQRWIRMGIKKDYSRMRECTCDVLGKVLLRDSNSKLIQFLMKLNDDYESVRSQILAMDPLPIVNKAYYIVQQIEKQKQVTNYSFKPTAFFVNLNNKGGNTGRKDNRGSRNDGKNDGKKAKKQGRIAANVSLRFNDHFSADTPFDMGYKNEIGTNSGGVKLLDCQSPFEKLYGKSPTYDHLRVIGCLCYASNIRPHKDKFISRGIKSMLVSYPVNQNGYKLYNWETKEVFLSRDVVFEENIFLFRQIKTPIVPDSTLIYPTFETHDEEMTEHVNLNTPLLAELNISDATTDNIPLSNYVLVNPTPTVSLKKSSRNTIRPAWLQDFVTPKSPSSATSTPRYPLFVSLKFKNIPHSHIAFLANVFANSEPTSYAQTKKDIGSVRAIEAELVALERNRTWTVTSLPKGHKPITFNGFKGEEFTAILVYVDDMLITSNSTMEIQTLKQRLTTAKPFSFPLLTQLKLSLDKGTPLSDVGSYRRLIGQKFLWSLGNCPTIKTYCVAISLVIIETRGRKKSVMELAPPAHDPRGVEIIERLHQQIQELELLYRDDPIRSLGLKIEIPEFTGKVHLYDFFNWLSTVERVFDVRDIPDKLKVKLIAIKLRQHASLCRFTPPTRTAPPTAPKATTPTILTVVNTREHVDNAPHYYKCGELGHFAHDCLNLKTLAFVPDDAGPIYDTDAEDEFSIGKSYKDEVCCEVIPIDTAHILLGRPWKFYMKTKHDGFQNTYNFKKDGVNITLVPFDSQENEITSEAPLQVQPLLREFADVIPDDIPPRLPAMRDIQHCIDFIPGSTIPKRPDNRMNLKEFAELQRQVTELLEKGLIRESMSPCVVPTLLVPKHGGLFGCVLILEL